MIFCCEKQLRERCREARLSVGSKNDSMDRMFAQRGAFSPIPGVLLCVVVPSPGSPPVLTPSPASDAFVAAAPVPLPPMASSQL
jgi:hypothetical protein